mgnify:CR=1 FL=1|jgi:CRISPR-associated protein Csm3
MKLTAIRKVEGTITLESGLHIGSGDMEMHIGGTDSPVIKHPHTLDPYIPGSSLKGKVRSLLEMESGLMVHTNGNVVSSKHLNDVKDDEVLRNKCEAILKVFGTSGSHNDDNVDLGPTRVSFADCYLDSEWKNLANENRWLLTEEKSENSINRISGTAVSPRFIERVPEGTRFRLLVTFKILQEGDDKLFNDILLKGLKLLEMDALGGSGSRGYGRVSFKFDEKTMDDNFRALKVFDEGA